MENKEWFLYVVDHHEGPFTAGEIKKLVKKGEARTSSYVWKDGLDDWMLMSDMTEFGPGGAKSDGHGRFAFLTDLFSKKKKEEQPAAAAGAAAAAAAADGATAFDPNALSSGGEAQSTPTGPDISDVSPSDSVWCLNSQKQFSGPYSLKNLVRKINDGEVSVEDGVWRDGWKSFVRISNISGFMEGVKPDVLEGKASKRKKKVSAEAKASAAAMGIGGGAAVRRYRWYRSRKFSMFVTVAFLLAVYQMLAMGYLAHWVGQSQPATAEKIRAKVTELGLKPLPVNNLLDYVGPAKELAMPLFNKVVVMLPEPISGYFSPLQIPEGIKPGDAETLREAASTDLKQGVRVAAALPAGDELNPGFLIATNAPDSTSFTVILRGQEGTLLGAQGYEKTFAVDVAKHVASVPRFMFDGSKPLPKGQYTLLIYEADKQASNDAITALANSPKRQAPALIPAGKVAFVVDNFFLGGPRDATYESRLKEFKDKVAVKMGEEGGALKQYALLVEQITNESADTFRALIPAPPGPARTRKWQQYHANYTKMSGQIKAAVTPKLTPEGRKDSVVPQLWDQLNQTYLLTEGLHQSETDAIEKGGTIEAVMSQAPKVAGSINDLKQAVLKISK